MANYRTYRFEPSKFTLLSKKHGRATSVFTSWITETLYMSDEMKKDWEEPKGDVSHYSKLDENLLDSCKVLLTLSNKIKGQISACEQELLLMKQDLTRLEKIIGDNFKDQVVIIDDYAFTVNSLGGLTKVGKIA